jgi:hypothetical protein
LAEEYQTVNTIAAPSIVACDGAVNSHEAGAFGWALSDTEGNRKATGSGLVRGSRISSYRAEGYGILAVVRFFHGLQEHTQSPERMDAVRIVCDNVSMVHNVYKLLPRQDDPDHNCNAGKHPTLEPLQPEWDVLNEIWHTVKSWIGLRIAHVKGHQGNNTPVELLPIEAA